jgi:hypothetical protein
MSVLLEVHYIAVEVGSKIMRRGEFKLKGKKKEEVALKFWKWIKRQYFIEMELEKVKCDGEDITGLVRKLLEEQ